MAQGERVVLESPYAGDTADEITANLEYARACMADCFWKGEIPFASHLLYTQPGILDDRKPDERAKGMAAGFAWLGQAHRAVVYTDRGISPGMVEGIIRASKLGVPVELRQLEGPKKRVWPL